MRSLSSIHLFAASISFTVFLLLFRIAYSGSGVYLFFVWNIFLAIVPLGISILLSNGKNKTSQLILFGLWLLFFPNSIYLVTDIVHLKERQSVPLWFDAILVFSAAMNGMCIAFVSLQHVELFLKTRFTIMKTNIILVTCCFLASFGVYLGRFLRWNSWDIVTDPSGLLYQITDRFLFPLKHPRTWEVTIILTFFFSIFYFMLKNIVGSTTLAVDPAPDKNSTAI